MNKNTFWSMWKKTMFISIIFELIFAWVLVKLFGNHYEGESILGDVILVIFIMWGIQLFFSLKDLLFWYLNYKLNQKELVDSEVQFLILNKFPPPNKTFDLDNPEFYYQDIVENELLTPEIRMMGYQKYMTFMKNETFGSLIRNVVMNNSYKESIKRYSNYCDNNVVV